MNVANFIEIIGLIDGTTINGILRVENLPLIQRYAKGTDKFIPDFDSLETSAKSVAVLILRDTTGMLYVPSIVKWMYNGIELTFDANGLSNNGGMAGVFQKIDRYSTNVGIENVELPALRVMKNLVPLSGYDNDRLSVSGTIEVDGSQIGFGEVPKEVIIQETTGNQYDILISNSVGSQILSPTDKITQSVLIFKDGVKVTDLTGITYKWYKMLAAGDIALGTAATQLINADDVDNVLRMRCDVYHQGVLIGSGYDQVTDFSDLYICECIITGIVGRRMSKGETLTMTPAVVNARTGDTVVTSAATWTWRNVDNDGADFILTGKTEATFTSPTMSYGYTDMKRAKYRIGTYVNGQITLAG